MRNRLDILKDIDVLYNNCESCEFNNRMNQDKCKPCPIYAQLNALGDELSSVKSTRIQSILNKGRDMRASEIDYLFDQDVSKESICKAMKMTHRTFEKIYKNMKGITV